MWAIIPVRRGSFAHVFLGARRSKGEDVRCAKAGSGVLPSLLDARANVGDNSYSKRNFRPYFLAGVKACELCRNGLPRAGFTAGGQSNCWRKFLSEQEVSTKFLSNSECM